MLNGKNWWTSPPTEFCFDETGHLIPDRMNVTFKKLHPDAVTPTYAKQGDAGLDLTAISKRIGKNYIEYGTGIAIEIPVGHVGLLFPRSSITKMAPGVSLKNSVGVIDSGYRGELMFRFELPSDHFVWDNENFMDGRNIILDTPMVGDKIGQLIIMPYPTIELTEVDELSDTDRGDGGFGSTGR